MQEKRKVGRPRKDETMTEKQFDALTLNEKRVVVAKDVIRNINIGKVIAKRGQYIKILKIDSGVKADDDVRKNFDKIKECKACAMGALLLSYAKFKNRVTIDNIANNNSSDSDGFDKFKLLGELFTPKELMMIESAFEGLTNGTRVADRLFYVDRYDNVMYNSTKKYIRRFEHTQEGSSIHDELQNNANERLIAIMQDIINNKGIVVAD